MTESPVNDSFLRDLNEFCRRFTVCDMKRAEWTHEAHLAVGAWHVDRYSSDAALAATVVIKKEYAEPIQIPAEGV